MTTMANGGWRMADGIARRTTVCSSIHHPPSAIRRGHCRGLTIIELLLALAGTALIGAAIASMMFAVSYGTSSSRELRELAVKNKALSARLTAAVRRSSMVLEAGDDYLVLWVYDLNGDGVPGTREIQRLDYDADAATLTSYEPDPAAADAALALEDDFAAVTDALIAAGDLAAVLWAERVSSWQLTLDDADAQQARLLGLRLTLDAGKLSDVAITAVSLRN